MSFLLKSMCSVMFKIFCLAFVHSFWSSAILSLTQVVSGNGICPSWFGFLCLWCLGQLGGMCAWLLTMHVSLAWPWDNLRLWEELLRILVYSATTIRHWFWFSSLKSWQSFHNSSMFCRAFMSLAPFQGRLYLWACYEMGFAEFVFTSWRQYRGLLQTIDVQGLHL